MKRSYLQKKADKMDTVGFPDWLSRSCPNCKSIMPKESLIGMGVELTPKTFGNFSTAYVCDNCSSLVELHYVKALFGSVDIATLLASDEQPSEPVTYEQIIMSEGHNLDDND